MVLSEQDVRRSYCLLGILGVCVGGGGQVEGKGHSPETEGGRARRGDTHLSFYTWEAEVGGLPHSGFSLDYIMLRVSYSPGYPGACYIDQAGPRDTARLCLPSTGIKDVHRARPP